MREQLDTRISDKLHFAAVAAHGCVQNGDIAKAVSFDIEPQTRKCARYRLDGDHPALRHLRSSPEDEDADITADIQHGVGRPQFETGVRIPFSCEDFPLK